MFGISLVMLYRRWYRALKGKEIMRVRWIFHVSFLLFVSWAYAETELPSDLRLYVKTLSYSGPNCLEKTASLSLFVRVGCAHKKGDWLEWTHFKDLEAKTVERNRELDLTEETVPSIRLSLGSFNTFCPNALTAQLLIPGNMTQNPNNTYLGKYADDPTHNLGKALLLKEDRPRRFDLTRSFDVGGACKNQPFKLSATLELMSE